MPILSTVHIFLLTGFISLCYVLFGGWLYVRYDGVGVSGLSAFAVLWGLNFILSTSVLLSLFNTGITSASELAGLSFSRSTELLFITSAPAQSALTVGAILSWSWFVFTYTTRIRKRDRRLLFGLGAGLFLITSANGLIGALYAFRYISLPPFLIGSIHEFINVLEILGTGIAIGLGTAQLFRTAQRHPPFRTGAAVGLTLPVVFPYLLRYAYQFAIIPQFQTITSLRLVTLALGIVGLVAATKRYETFDQLPAAKAIGRNASFQTTNTPIIVIDDNNAISDMNAAAEELFNTTAASSVGSSIHDVLPQKVDTDGVIELGSLVFEYPGTSKIIEAETTSNISRGQEFGRVIAFNDITTERRRKQRIEVLNRVLRHNLRNDITVANGRIGLLPDGGAPIEETVSTVQSKLDNIVTMGAKAGEIEDVLNTDPTVETKAPIAETVRDAAKEVREMYPKSHITVETDDMHAEANPYILHTIIKELVWNAAEHTAGDDIRVVTDADARQIRVSDAGPGIPENEIEVLETGQETALQHSNGLGLWLVKWGAERLNGDIVFESDTTGTEARVQLPEEDED